MKRVALAAAAAAVLAMSASISVAFAEVDPAATQPAGPDQAAVDALAVKIADAIKALGDSPSEDAVLSAIESASAGSDIATISAALDKVGQDTSLPATAKTAVANAASDAKTALNSTNNATGGIGGNNSGSAFNYSAVNTGSQGVGPAGGGYLNN